MAVRHVLLFAGAIAAATSTQPEPALAGGNGAGIALGILGGIIAGAAVAGAARQPAPAYPQYAYPYPYYQPQQPYYQPPQQPYYQPRQPAYKPAVPSETTIALSSNGSSYFVDGTVNGIATQFTVDTGAEPVVLSLGFARQLMDQGRLTSMDMRGMSKIGVANGNAQQALPGQYRNPDDPGRHREQRLGRGPARRA